jgi:flagellar hook-length control protein FliK
MNTPIQATDLAGLISQLELPSPGAGIAPRAEQGAQNFETLLRPAPSRATPASAESESKPLPQPAESTRKNDDHANAGGEDLADPESYVAAQPTEGETASDEEHDHEPESDETDAASVTLAAEAQIAALTVVPQPALKAETATVEESLESAGKSPVAKKVLAIAPQAVATSPIAADETATADEPSFPAEDTEVELLADESGPDADDANSDASIALNAAPVTGSDGALVPDASVPANSGLSSAAQPSVVPQSVAGDMPSAQSIAAKSTAGHPSATGSVQPTERANQSEADADRAIEATDGSPDTDANAIEQLDPQSSLAENPTSEATRIVPSHEAPAAPDLLASSQVSQRALADSQPAGPLQQGPESAAAWDHSSRVLHRVARAFAAAQNGDGEVRLRLSPPELGAVRLEVRVQSGAMVARLETETSAARTIIMENLPALRERLAEQGMRIDRFDVDLMQRNAGGPADHSGQGQANEQTRLPRTDAPEPRRPQPTEGVVARRVAMADIDSRRLNVIV